MVESLPFSQNITLSSAYFTILLYLTWLDTSLKDSTNNIDPKIDPCGTPVFLEINFHFDKLEFVG